MEQIKRYYVERKPEFRDEAEKLKHTLQEDLHLTTIEAIRILARYDVANVSDAHQEDLVAMVLSVPKTDKVYTEQLPEEINNAHLLAVESLPGQYDQRADSCTQCIEVITGERPQVRSAMVYAFFGHLTEDEKDKLETYLVNPVESRLADMAKPESLKDTAPQPEPVQILHGFIDADADALQDIKSSYGLAMELDDLTFMQDYFKKDMKRNPTETELRMVDTYWSDHCRHTTFHTQLDNIQIDDAVVQEAYNRYQAIRHEVFGEKAKTRPVTLMDMGTLATKYLKKTGKVRHLDESEEVNACSVEVQVDENGVQKPWLFMFKNETHNHPTEIEPFGGASTCLGGAIRDPLSGRSYVHQGMRLTGAADPRTPIAQTRTGKLPQKKICTLAAEGFASYGNQIGVATGLVDEVYHPGYEAKRMEVGAVLAAAPAEHVVREVPQPGDIVVLLGGRTGRDGVGGATGSSKTHTEDSLETSGAEVQKGNPVEERKIQRLFRRSDVAPLIKRCNDFGAGGVSVAIGELADGVEIFLDRIPTKYKGLNGTELALSESQERMACVIAKSDWPFFEAAALSENLEATAIADVTADNKVTMWFQGQKIVELDRFFLDSAGATKTMAVHVLSEPNSVETRASKDDFATRMTNLVQDLNICTKEGLIEQFDATVGAGTVLFPLGGFHQKTPIQTMAAKIPVEQAETDTATLFAYGFDPAHSAQNPYRGAYDAVVESVCKLMASGADSDDIYLSLQEYFHSLRNDPSRWGEPFKAVLGALMAQLDLEIPAIGGKDSMSGSFEDLDVPPTLISFATTLSTGAQIISPEFKKAGSTLYRVTLKRDDTGHVVTEDFKEKWQIVRVDIAAGNILSGWAVNRGGLAEGFFKMALGNQLGVDISKAISLEELFVKAFGTIIFEATAPLAYGEEIGTVTSEPCICYGNTCIDIKKMFDQSQRVLADIYPDEIDQTMELPEVPLYTVRSQKRTLPPLATPKVIIPALPGTNCEYDTARAFRLAGAEVTTVVIGNLTPERLRDSVEALYKAMAQAQILALPGGFSFGDEPDGSGKFVSAFFREPTLAEAIHHLLEEQDGLILGICNGFQALVKLGLLPYGEIRDPKAIDATLTRNVIGRHQSRYVHTRIASVASPWLTKVDAGDCHTIPVSHGEGRFIAGDDLLQQLIQNGQVATQYVDDTGNPSMDIRFNPNGSMAAIEGLLSPNGRILGKMGHSERMGKHIAKNIPGNKDQRIFESGVGYFKD